MNLLIIADDAETLLQVLTEGNERTMLDHATKTGDQLFVKSTAISVCNHLQGNVLRKGLLVASYACQGVVGVSNGNHLRAQRDLFSAQSVGVSHSVDSFVMASCDLCGIFHYARIDILNDGLTNRPLAQLRVLFYDVILKRRQDLGGIENAFRDLLLSYVVQGRGHTNGRDFRFRQGRGK